MQLLHSFVHVFPKTV